MGNSMVMINFSVLTGYTHLEQTCKKSLNNYLFKLKFDAWTNVNIQNLILEVGVHCVCFRLEIPFLGIFCQKKKSKLSV